MTAGEAAVALVVSAAPRALVLDPIEGCASAEVADLRRPRPLQEAGDALRSVSAYLDLLDLAWEEYRRQAGPVRFEEHFRYMAFHTPLVWLVRQGHRALLQGDRGDATDGEVAASFARMVAPSLRYPRVVGNAYSGCVFVALLGVLDGLDESDAGARVGLFSYGSGASAEVFSGTVAPAAPAVMARRAIETQLDARHEVSVADVDAAAEAVHESLTAASFVPDRTAPAWRFKEAYGDQGRLVLDHVQAHARHYVWA